MKSYHTRGGTGGELGGRSRSTAPGAGAGEGGRSRRRRRGTWRSPCPPSPSPQSWGEGEGGRKTSSGRWSPGGREEWRISVRRGRKKEERGGGREDSGRVSGTCQNWQGKGAQYTGRLWALCFFLLPDILYFVVCDKLLLGILYCWTPRSRL